MDRNAVTARVEVTLIMHSCSVYKIKNTNTRIRQKMVINILWNEFCKRVNRESRSVDKHEYAKNFHSTELIFIYVNINNTDNGKNVMLFVIILWEVLR